MSTPSQIATEGGTLNLAVAPGGTVNVTLDALGSPPRSFDPDGTIAAFEWSRNGARLPIPTFISVFTLGFTVGTHVLSLVVVDNQGARSAPVQGTIVVSDTGLY